jgi:hypothetical protein
MRMKMQCPTDLTGPRQEGRGVILWFNAYFLQTGIPGKRH